MAFTHDEFTSSFFSAFARGFGDGIDRTELPHEQDYLAKVVANSPPTQIQSFEQNMGLAMLAKFNLGKALLQRAMSEVEQAGCSCSCPVSARHKDDKEK